MKMIKVLLVEDNKLAIDYLKNLINWENYGFTVAATARDGEEGLKQFKAVRPQLMITDIQMPVCNGIELTREIRKIDKEARIIFLSSYQEFSYAKSAFDLGVCDYLLKHEFNEQSLAEKLMETKLAIEESDIVSRVRFETLLGEIFFSGEAPDDGTAYTLMAFERDFPLDIIRGYRLARLDTGLVKKACYETSRAIKGVIQVEGDLYAMMVTLSDISASDFAYDFKSAMEAAFACSLSVLIIGEHVPLPDFRRLYAEFVHMLHYRFFTKPSSVLNSVFYEPVQPSSAAAFDLSLLKTAIEKKDVDSTVKLVDAEFYEIIRYRDYDRLLATSQTLADYLVTFETKERLTFHGKFCLFDNGDTDRLYTVRGVAGLFREKLIHLIELLNDDVTEVYSPYVKATIRYIFEQYAQVDLSVEGIAANIGLPPDKLGGIFKKDTGRSIREYLNLYRIEKSKALIESGVKINHIHDKVGYLTSQYFSKVFHKVTGQTPVEYRRDQLRGRTNE